MIYLDNAATTFPKPAAVAERMAAAVSEFGGNPGRSSHRMAMLAEREVFACRCDAAEMFGARPENVVFACNATFALNMAMKSAYTGGSILISDLEHNSVRRPALSLTSGKPDAEVFVFDSCLESGADRTDRILESVRSCLRRARNCGMLVMTAASNICGASMPIREVGELCREKGITFIVDAAQAGGHRNIDVMADKIDALCLPGHKGLYGAQGSGMMILGEKTRFSGVFAEGGSGVDSLSEKMPEVPPERYEAGTLSVPCIASLRAGMAFVRENGAETLGEREAELADIFRDALCHALGGRVKIYAAEHRGGIVLFSVSGYSAADVGAFLDDHGVYVRSGYHCSPLAHQRLGTENGAVRVSFGAFNTEDDALETVSILRRI